MSWQTPFIEPVLTPDGVTLHTLRDAREYVLKLPAAFAAQSQWQAAIEAILLVGDGDGPTDFARIGIMQALYHAGVRTEAAGLTYRSRG